jgi:hypothetical protein
MPTIKEKLDNLQDLKELNSKDPQLHGYLLNTQMSLYQTKLGKAFNLAWNNKQNIEQELYQAEAELEAQQHKINQIKDRLEIAQIAYDAIGAVQVP